MKKIISVFLISFLLCGCSPSLKVKKLLDELVSNERVPDNKALNELVKIGKPAVKPALAGLKKENDPWKQQYYLILLFSIADESVSDEILPYTNSESGDVREWTIFVLGKIGNKNSIEALINSLSDSAVEDSAKEQAVERLQYLTGKNIPFKESMSFEKKQTSVKAWQDWLKSVQKPN